MNWIKKQLYRLEMRNANLLMVVLFTAVVFLTLAVSTLAAMILGDFGSPTAALWWGVKALLDPGYLDESRGTLLGSVSFVVVLIGFVFVNGGIVATVVSLVTQRIEADKRGLGQVPFSNHIVILNENDKLDEVINELGSGDRHMEIAILVPDGKEECEARILRSIGPEVEARTTIVCRKGLPQYAEDLDRVSTRTARAVLVLQAQRSEGMLSLKQDMIGLKALMVLDRLVPDNIPLVVELGSRDSLAHIRSLISRRNVSFLNGNSLIGWILCHASLEPERVRIYDELFSRWGSEIYRKKIAWPAGTYPRYQFIQQYAQTHNGQIPLGTVHDGVPRLNPDEWIVEGSTEFIMLSADSGDPGESTGRPHSTDVTCGPGNHVGRTASILVLGSNSRLDYLLEAYKCYILDNDLASNDSIIRVQVVTEAPVELMEQSAPGLTVTTTVLDYIRHPYRLGTLLATGEFDSILLLSDETVPPQEQDVNVLAAVVVINRILDKSNSLKKTPTIIAEVLDQHNERILKEYRVPNVIVSSKLTSHLLARYVEDPVVAPVYEDLLDFRGQEICTRPAAEYFSIGTELRFSDALTALSKEAAILIGVIDSQGVTLNPSFDATLTVDACLRFIIVADS